MGSTDAKSYRRLRISGRLTCTAPLHVGDGGDADFKPRSPDPKAKGLYRSVCRDADDKPYVPATTLRGHLRDVAGPALAPTLFGQIKGDQGLVGQVRVNDATWRAAPADTRLPYWDQRLATGIRHGLGIDPVTGTVGDNLLYRHELVPAGTSFSWTLEAEDLTDDQLADLLGLLGTFDGGADAGVGRGRSRIEGGLTWSLDRVEGIADAALVAWLDDADTKALTEVLEVIASPPQPRRPQRPTGPQIDLIVTPTGPLLINEPGLVTPKPERPPGVPEDPDGPHDPDLEFSRTPDGKAIIPAASLRGLLRGRARRILATIATSYGAQAPGDVAEGLVGLLFGTTGWRGRITYRRPSPPAPLPIIPRPSSPSTALPAAASAASSIRPAPPSAVPSRPRSASRPGAVSWPTGRRAFCSCSLATPARANSPPAGARPAAMVPSTSASRTGTTPSPVGRPCAPGSTERSRTVTLQSGSRPSMSKSPAQ